MNLRNQIKSDKTFALKNDETIKKNLLSTVLGEIDRKSKESGRTNPEVSDEEVITIIKKMKDDCIKCNNAEEAKMLEKYIPKMYTEEILETIIGDYVTSENIEHKKDMGQVMKWLKEHHHGKYDGKIASSIVVKKLK